jgi:hypothetical protein
LRAKQCIGVRPSRMSGFKEELNLRVFVDSQNMCARRGSRPRH